MAMSGKFDPKMLSALDLAFVGDGVYGLLVREMLARDGSRPVGELHRMAVADGEKGRGAVAYVNATAQAAAYDRIAPLLTEQEQAVYRRGRNGGAHPPKNADPGHYAKATGLEALFGYLYLNGEQERARELFEAITANKENAKQN